MRGGIIELRNKLQKGGESINANLIRAKIVEKGLTGQKVAKLLGISSNSFYRKLKREVFLSSEMERMIDILNIENPGEFFFGKK